MRVITYYRRLNSSTMDVRSHAQNNPFLVRFNNFKILFYEFVLPENLNWWPRLPRVKLLTWIKVQTRENMHQQQVAPLKVSRLLRVLLENTFKPIKHLNGHSFNAILNCGIMNFLFVHKIQVQSVQRYDTQFVIDVPGKIATILKRSA